MATPRTITPKPPLLTRIRACKRCYSDVTMQRNGAAGGAQKNASVTGVRFIPMTRSIRKCGSLPYYKAILLAESLQCNRGVPHLYPESTWDHVIYEATSPRLLFLAATIARTKSKESVVNTRTNAYTLTKELKQTAAGTII